MMTIAEMVRPSLSNPWPVSDLQLSADLPAEVQDNAVDETLPPNRDEPSLRLAPDLFVQTPWVLAEMVQSPAASLQNSPATPSCSPLREGFDDPFMGSPQSLAPGSQQRCATDSCASPDEQTAAFARLAPIYPHASLEMKAQLTLAGIIALPWTWRFQGHNCAVIHAHRLAGSSDADTVKRGCEDIRNILMSNAQDSRSIRYCETFDILAISPVNWLVSLIDAVNQLQIWPALQSTQSWLPAIGQWHAPKPNYVLPRHVPLAAECIDPLMASSRSYPDSGLFWIEHRLSMLERARELSQRAEQDYQNLLCWAVAEPEI